MRIKRVLIHLVFEEKKPVPRRQVHPQHALTHVLFWAGALSVYYGITTGDQSMTHDLVTKLIGLFG